MKTFVMMTRVAASDAQLLKIGSKLQDRARNSAAWLDEIKAKCPEVKFLAHFAILGQWDFMDIYEAPDEETAAKVSLISRGYGAHEIQNWPAIPYEKIIKLAEEISSPQGEDT